MIVLLVLLALAFLFAGFAFSPLFWLVVLGLVIWIVCTTRPSRF